MPNPCGCISERCTCYLDDGPGIAIGGSGTNEDAFTITALGGRTFFDTQDTAEIQWTLTGDGTQATPYALSGTALIVAAPPNIQQFTANGTWTRPAGTSMIHIILIGGGGGGGGGLVVDDVSYVNSGGGGGGGGYAEFRGAIPATVSTLAITIGAGGTGGAVGTLGGNVGGDGQAGGVTQVGNLARVGGGSGGKGAYRSNYHVLTPALGGYGQPPGGTGGVPSQTVVNSGAAVGGLQSTGGGAGQFATSFGTYLGGLQQGDNKAGGAAATAGNAGSDFGGGTGGGGGTLAGTTGTIGGAGGTKGGGGGGAAGIDSATGTATAGAAGAAGYVRIYAW